MESLKKDQILEFNPNTIQTIRKLYDLDKPGRMDQAIDILDTWVKMQPHFKKKDFDRDFLEKVIIGCKGSVERAKTRIDRGCTLRTLLPEYFVIENPRIWTPYFEQIKVVLLPKPTDDHCRVSIVKTYSKPLDFSTALQIIRYSFMSVEYLKAHDYNNNVIIFSDYTDANIIDVATKFSPTDMKHGMSLFTDCFGMRVKGIHLLTESKTIEVLLKILKQMFSAKIAGRIHVHKNMNEVYKHIPKRVFPKNYGGDEQPLDELHEKWLDILGSEDHMNYMKKSSQACTDESLRPKDKFNEEYIGMSGSFRTLTVD